MRAVICRSYGTPEDLVIDDVPDPVAAPGQLLVRVRAAAVNFPDVLFIAGKYQVKIPPPFIPGNEIAGEVIAAYIGATGQNPRKGITGTTGDVIDELLDVAVTALAAVEHLSDHQGHALRLLDSKILHVVQRAGVTA